MALRSTVRNFRWPTRSFAPGSTCFPPTAKPTIDEIVARVHASDRAKKLRENAPAARESQRLIAKRLGQKDEIIADEVSNPPSPLDEKTGQYALDFPKKEEV